jgi:hypothetical protein
MSTPTLDPGLRERLATSMDAVLAHLDAALVEPTPDTLDLLLEATDDLMRASARIVIEIERTAHPC